MSKTLNITVRLDESVDNETSRRIARDYHTSLTALPGASYVDVLLKDEEDDVMLSAASTIRDYSDEDTDEDEDDDDSEDEVDDE